MTSFDEYQSKENGKHTLRAMKENARQGFWNGARAPTGYRVVAAGERGAKIKKKLEIDPLQAETVRRIFARDQVRAVAQRVEVMSKKEVRIRGLRSELLRTLTGVDHLTFWHWLRQVYLRNPP